MPTPVAANYVDNAKLRVLLADDHAILRDSLSALIDMQPNMEVVAQAETGDQALALANECSPDVVVLDVSMDGMGGVEVAGRLALINPHVRILALTRHNDSMYLQRMLEVGAKGYVLKQAAAEVLISAIRVVGKGGTYIQPEVRNRLGQRPLTRHVKAKTDSVAHLTSRETEVLSLVAWGLSNREVARKLSLSIKTVESYKATAVGKLSLRNRSDIVRYALSRGWLREDLQRG
jgi:two-component system response regulator NreC